jgi:hypothetical protein
MTSMEVGPESLPMMYELTALKRECRRRRRERVRSGSRFGVYCFGSSIGLRTCLWRWRSLPPGVTIAAT